MRTMRRPWIDSDSYGRRRLRGRAYMAMRRQVFSEESACYKCESPGEADDALDHVVPVVAGGTDERSNLRRCCRSCHLEKSATEQPRGRA